MSRRSRCALVGSRQASTSLLSNLLCLSTGVLTQTSSDMGGKSAPLPVSVGVGGILKTVLSLKPEDSGQFFNFQGERVPW